MFRPWVARVIPVVAAGWVVVLALVVGWTPDDTVRAIGPAGPAVELAALVQEQGYVGDETCQVCHESQTEQHRRSVHGAIETSDLGIEGCESCHGPGGRHIEDPETVHMIFAAADLDHSAQDRSGQCLSCHVGDAATFDYRSSNHLAGAIDCAACHQPHAAQDRDLLRLDTSLESCLGCHQEVRTAMHLNERHRVLEGMVTCADCHQQHGPSPRARLGGFNDETCAACHVDKQGPFVFEHLAVRVEGCASCHEPHGSPNRHMLANQSVADLCYSCHVEVPGFHKGFPGAPLRFDSTTNCTNCHAEIHGSNLDSHFLR